MKKNYFLGVLLLLAAASFAQNVTFSDAKFKAKLLTSTALNDVAKDLNGNFFKIDANNDGEIQLTEALQVSYIDIKCNSCSTSQKVNTIGGINSFTNLITFKLRFQSIDNIEISGLAQLEEIDASNNETAQVTITGATGLKKLNVTSGTLTSLNATVFPNLEELTCTYQANLTTLNVSGLAALKILMLGYSGLSQLNLAGMSALEELRISNSQFTSLDLSQAPNLKELFVENNNLTALDLSAQTNLITLQCHNNSITQLDLSGKPNLDYVYSINNDLTTLNVSGATNLTYLGCSNNQISTLDLTGMTILEDLYCNNNLLTSVDTNDCASLQSVYVSNNPQLQYAFFKNGSNETEMVLTNTPNLIYVCGDDFDISQLQPLIPPTCHVNTYCSFIPGGTTYVIQGENRYDMDGNGCNGTDISYPNLKFNIATGTIQSTIISDESGAYDIVVQQGTHTLDPILENPSYFTVSPSTVSVTFPADASPATHNFCITPNGNHPDVEVVILPIGVANPGFNITYKIIYRNKGNVVQSGAVNFAFDESIIDYVSSSPSLTMQSGGLLVWDYANLLPFETRTIAVTFNLNSATETPSVNLDDILVFESSITTLAGDEYADDNLFTLNQTVVGSYDPNDKTCLQGNTVGPTMIGEYVHYIIRFENTGTFPAQNIVVKDMIDTAKFDVSTLIPLGGSHAFETRISSTNKVEFIFENIMLPFDDANNDGYVAFKIKTLPSLVVGDTFSNTARIYFDYNFPIVTNTSTTTIQALATQDFEFSKYFTLYPNPAKNTLNIKTNDSIQMKTVNIYNMLGQLVLVITDASAISEIDVSDLKSGNYFIKINSDKGTSTGRFIIE